MPRRNLALALAAAMVLVAPSGAGAAADVEGIWSYRGGQVAVQAAADGTFEGTVIRRAAFSDCVHPVGEQIWSGIVAQPDGSYRGGHRWFAAGCRETIGFGAAAYRVLGSGTLRVCFADPASTTVRPAIATDGIPAHIERPCADFERVALPARTSSLRDITDLPSSRRCRTSRSLTIKLRDPDGDALSSVVVSRDGKRVPVPPGPAATAVVTLAGLPSGGYVVKVHATTVLGRIIAGARHYRTCTAART
ncbi:MAG TPA: hypothetical protein VMY78_04195 [Solirubrobacteraceae bacterium]|nr:hypothetical protein [Solirubrobacteraceae bacterium]